VEPDDRVCVCVCVCVCVVCGGGFETWSLRAQACSHSWSRMMATTCLWCTCQGGLVFEAQRLAYHSTLGTLFPLRSYHEAARDVPPVHGLQPVRRVEPAEDHDVEARDVPPVCPLEAVREPVPPPEPLDLSP